MRALTCTKVTAPSLWMASAVSLGRSIAPIRVGTNGSTSRFPTTPHASVIASTAAVCTCAASRSVVSTHEQ